MDGGRLVPILHLVEHQVSGEQRWTGTVNLPGAMSLVVLILRVDGSLLAVRNRCPHRDISLLSGKLDAAARILECPSHGLQLSLDGLDLVGRPVVEREGGFYLLVDQGDGA